MSVANQISISQKCQTFRHRISVYCFSSGPASSSTTLSLPGAAPTSAPAPIDTSLESIEVEDRADNDLEVSTSHKNPDWLRNLKLNFSSIVIEECSKKVRDAVEGNIKFENVKEHREVRLAIMHSTLDHISGVFGGVGKPKLTEMKEVVGEMGSVYPNMFKFSSSATGYGLGGSKGVEGLANNMLDMLRGREGPRNKNPEDDEEISVKKGKRKMIYGTRY